MEDGPGKAPFRDEKIDVLLWATKMSLIDNTATPDEFEARCRRMQELNEEHFRLRGCTPWEYYKKRNLQFLRERSGHPN